LGKKVEFEVLDNPRVGDHIWWVTDNSKFISQYPDWSITIDLEEIITEIYANTLQTVNEV
jgi:CDP-paratose 2-epimerase